MGRPGVETELDTSRPLVGADDATIVAPADLVAPLDGIGIDVFVYDGGYVDADHPDFTGRLTLIPLAPNPCANTESGHATHVAGIVGGDGGQAVAQSLGIQLNGMAPNVAILSAFYCSSSMATITNQFENAINVNGAEVATISMAVNAAGGAYSAKDQLFDILGLGLLLIALYVLLQLTLSTLAKTSGTAILFGILAWLAFNVLYPVITLILSSVLFASDFEAQFRFSQVVGLGNPSWIYQQLVAFAAPEERAGAFPATTLGLQAVALAAGVWFAFLLGLALWTFQREAAE